MNWSHSEMSKQTTITTKALDTIIDQVIASDDEELITLIESPGVRLNKDTKARRDALLCVALKIELRSLLKAHRAIKLAEGEQ